MTFTGLDSNISRLTAITDSGVTLESYQYLGIGTVVARIHPQTGIDLTYIKRSGESDGDAGDQYTGLDRFGRVVDQRWVDSSSGTAVDRYSYTYDRDGNRLYVVQDANFSVTALVNTSGVVVERYVYDPYGTATVLDASWAVQSGGSAFGWQYLHQGGRLDTTSGLYYFRNWHYSPTLGRCVTMGDSGGTNNLHEYITNSPDNSRDSTSESGVKGDGKELHPDMNA